ncbi:MAG: glycyl-radical enzyme activating protein [Clostridia bacterium]|nr:glycyl-radical enzyme activating protein [Clostridia bacterium]
MKGRIFDIEEFAVYDGPGIRSTVFFKGCPLRCKWCHNPEGLDFSPTRVTKLQLCMHCSACDSVCPSPGKCTGCGACEKACPKGLIRIAGREVEAKDVADQILKNAGLLMQSGGGVTFSGGEALMQTDFLLELNSLLKPLHTAVETSGYASENVFQRAAKEMDLVIMDIKHTDPAVHKEYTGVDNELILKNLSWLMQSMIPFRIRVPLIPGVNDTEENLTSTARLLEGAKALEMIELLPYHTAAGAKYASVRKEYRPGFDTSIRPNAITEPFLLRNMEVHVL